MITYGASSDFAITIGVSIVLGVLLPIIIVPLLPYTKHFAKNGDNSDEINTRLAKLENQLSQKCSSEQNNIVEV